MKNFLEKLKSLTKQEFVDVKVSKNTHKYPKEVYEIHHAFETAGESILAEAQSILKDCESKSISKGKRLISLGFNQSKEAVMATEVLSKEATAKETADLVVYYKINYPNNKFITEDQVRSICEKWNLVCGNINLFRGFVPEKNLNMIEQFKLKPSEQIDRNKHYFFVSDTIGEEVWTLTNLKEHQVESANGWFTKRSNGYHYTKHIVSGYNPNKKICSSIQFPELLDELYKMKICAPANDMDLSGYSVHGYRVNKKMHIPDPVVLQPVRGGYLIITAWGDEASDENVVNQSHN